MTVFQIQKELTKKREKSSKLRDEIDGLVKQLQGVCDHSQTDAYQWEHDNGYGRQSKMSGKRCMYCGWIDLWNNGTFHNPKDITA
jgi:hypothetical protein